MSADIFRNFLPWTAEFVYSTDAGRRLWEVLLPEHVEQLCPVPSMCINLSEDTLFVVRWPLLAIMCVVGMLGGISAGWRLLSLEHHSSSRGAFTWGFAFIWYGLMCFGGLMYHCLRIGMERFYLLDVVSTGCCGISVVGGFLSIHKHIDDRQFFWRAVSITTYTCAVVVAVIGSPLARDQIYLAPIGATILTGCHYIIPRQPRILNKERAASDTAAHHWLRLGVCSCILAGSAALSDRWLCYAFGSHGSATGWVFLFCDIALLCSYNYVHNRMQQDCVPAVTNNKHKAQ